MLARLIDRIAQLESDRPDYSPADVRARWDRACSAVGLVKQVGIGEDKTQEWPKLGQASTIRDGLYRIPVYCPMGASVGDLAKVAPALREAVEAVHLEVEAPNGIDSRHGALLVDLRPRSTKPLLWTPPEARAAKVRVGRTMIGRPVMMPVPGRAPVAPHLLIAGATGAGKSNLMHVALGSLLAAGGVRIFAIDPGSVDLNRWLRATDDRQVFEEYATSADGWTDLLEHVYEQAKGNGAFIEEHGKSNLYECRDLLGCPPPIVLFVDELQRVMRTKKAQRLLLEIVQELRKFGVMVVAAMLTASYRDFDLGIRANFAARSCGTLMNRTDVEAVMGEYASTAPAHTLPMNSGQAYLAITGEPAAVRVQYRYLEPDLIPSIVEQYAPRSARQDPQGGGEEGASDPPPAPKHSRPHSVPPSPPQGVVSEEFARMMEVGGFGDFDAVLEASGTVSRDEPSTVTRSAEEPSASAEVHRPGHPLARANGMVVRMKLIAYEAAGEADVRCSSCGRDDLSWIEKGSAQIQVVALDRDRSNLSADNLAPMCRSCAGRHHRQAR